MKRIFILMMVLFCVFVFSNAYAQCASGNMKGDVVKGAVVDYDWVAGKLIVRTNSFDDPDEIVIFADSNTKIIKGTETIFFSDILQGDQVTVQYTAPSFSGLRALEIIVNE